jgi:hypothetical protein
VLTKAAILSYEMYLTYCILVEIINQGGIVSNQEAYQRFTQALNLLEARLAQKIIQLEQQVAALTLERDALLAGQQGLSGVDADEILDELIKCQTAYGVLEQRHANLCTSGEAVLSHLDWLISQLEQQAHHGAN